MALTKVSTDGVKDDAITKTKIPANQIEASELADNAVDTNAIANNAVTAGKLASGVQTTINNNADNRVITGSSTANTLNGESNVVINGSGQLGVGTTSPGQLLSLKVGSGQQCQQSLTSATDQSCAIYFGDTDSVNRSVIVHNNSDDSLAFNTAATERLRIDSSGNVGIGTGSNAIQANLHVEAAVPVIRMKDSDNNSAVQFVGQDGSIRYDADNDNIAADSHHAFKTDNVERVRIQAEGLTFNGDTAAANALDDYEEGTFTPAFTSVNGGLSIGYALQLGKYIKIGRLVYVSIYIILNAVNANGTGNFMITGLPFQHDSTSNHYAALALGYYAGVNGTIMQNGLVNTNDTTVHLYNGNANSTITNSTAAGVLTTNFQLLMSGTYMST